MHFFRSTAFRWSISIIMLALLCYQLWSRTDHFRTLSLDIFSKTGWWIVLVFFLMPVNLFVETLKWRTFLSVHIKVPLKYIFRAVAGGIALSLFTPNRIGEYGGRILFMPSESKWPVAISTFMGSYAQNLVALTAGISSCIFLFKGMLVLKILGIILVIIAGTCFFQMRKVIQRVSFLSKYSLIKKLIGKLHYIDDYSSAVLIRALLLALARYIVFSFQFILLLHAFEPSIQFGILFLGVSGMYLFQALVPLPPVADVMARTNIGLILWSGSGMSELSISLASLMIWLINLLIPAMLGSITLGTNARYNTLSTHDQFASSDFKPVVVEQSSNT